jgi:uncharacterized protein YaaW (UPF0174 family)
MDNKKIELRAQRMTIRLLRRILFRLTHGDETEHVDTLSRTVEEELQHEAALLEADMLTAIHTR